jgi:hypothetical protein
MIVCILYVDSILRMFKAMIFYVYMYMIVFAMSVKWHLIHKRNYIYKQPLSPANNLSEGGISKPLFCVTWNAI